MSLKLFVLSSCFWRWRGGSCGRLLWMFFRSKWWEAGLVSFLSSWLLHVEGLCVQTIPITMCCFSESADHGLDQPATWAQAVRYSNAKLTKAEKLMFNIWWVLTVFKYVSQSLKPATLITTRHFLEHHKALSPDFTQLAPTSSLLCPLVAK